MRSAYGGSTRRQALLTAAMAAGATLVPWARSAWAAAALRPARLATYRRLVVVAGAAPGFCPRDAANAARDFARWYGAQDPAIRTHADAILDALAPVLRGGPPPFAPEAQPHLAATLAAAAGLAAVTCAPPPDEDERPLAPPLWSAP